MIDKDCIPSKDSFLKKRENGLYLSDYEISILKRNGINYLEFDSINGILMAINDVLEFDFDEELENVALIIDEHNYYNNINK